LRTGITYLPLKKTALYTILSIFGGTALLLVILLLIDLNTIQNSEQTYLVSFDGKPTFRDGGFSALKTTLPNGSQYVSVYGIDTNVTFSTELVDEAGKNIVPNNMKLTLLNGTSNDSQFQASIIPLNKLGPGSYNGYVIAIKGNQEIISIPITVATKPLIWESIILVIIGVCISVCIWEVILQFRDSKKEDENKKLEQKSMATKKEVSKVTKLALKYSTEVEELKYLSSEGVVQPLDLVRAPIAKHSADYLDKDAEAKIDKAQVLQKQIAQNNTKLSKRRKKNSEPVRSAGRIALMELAPSLFGIFIAMFAVLNEQIVVGTAVLSSLLVAKLIGLGLVTGSLKQLFDK
jgi:hypothetical protein